MKSRSGEDSGKPLSRIFERRQRMAPGCGDDMTKMSEAEWGLRRSPEQVNEAVDN